MRWVELLKCLASVGMLGVCSAAVGPPSNPADRVLPELGQVECWRAKTGEIRLGARHARLDVLLRELSRCSGQRMAAAPPLESRRFHVYYKDRKPEQIREDLAAVTLGRWRLEGSAWRLDLTAEAIRILQERQAGDPMDDTFPPDAYRARHAALIVSALASPDAFAALKQGRPALFQQLSHPIVEAGLRGIRSFERYQAMLLTGHRGLRISGSRLKPEAKAQLLKLAPIAGATRVKSLAVKLGVDGGGVVVLDAGFPDPSQGNGISGSMLGDFPSRRAVRWDALPPHPNPPTNVANDSRSQPDVEPARFVVYSSGDTRRLLLYETLNRLSREYSVNIVAEVRFERDAFTPIASRRTDLESLSSRSPTPVGSFLKRMATLFHLSYHYQDGVHFLENPRFHWETRYAHTDNHLQRALQISTADTGKLTSREKFLDLSPAEVESLGAVFPWLQRLVYERSEVELYASLSPEARRLIHAGKNIPCTVLTAGQQSQFWSRLGCDSTLTPPAELSRYALGLIRGSIESLEGIDID